MRNHRRGVSKKEKVLGRYFQGGWHTGMGPPEVGPRSHNKVGPPSRERNDGWPSGGGNRGGLKKYF